MVTFVIFILTITFLVCNYIRTGYDYWWHLKSGEYMLEHHTILRTDIFSWLSQGTAIPWIAHEWLGECLLAILKGLFPTLHILLFCSVTFLAILLVLFLTNKKQYYKNILFGLFWLLLSVFFVGSFLMPRPQILGYLFFVLTLYLLFDLLRNEKSNKIYWLPVITLLWANIHGGSANLTYILCFVFFFLGNFNFSFAKIEAKPFHKKQQIKYFITMLLCIVAILINPQGISLLQYPYQTLQDSFMLQTIVEWRPSNPNLLRDLAIFALLSYLLFLMIKSDKKIRLLDLVLLGMFGFLALKSIRFWPFVYLSASFVIFHYIKERKFDYKISYAMFYLVIFLAIIFFPKSTLLEQLNAPVIDERFITAIKKESPQRLYNYYDYGGYLIYRDIPVFIDGRADIYTDLNYRDYYYMTMLQSDFKQLLERYRFDMLLLDKGTPLAYYIKDHPQYEKVLEEDNTILYRLK